MVAQEHLVAIIEELKPTRHQVIYAKLGLRRLLIAMHMTLLIQIWIFRRIIVEIQILQFQPAHPGVTKLLELASDSAR